MITWKDVKEHYIKSDLSLEKVAEKFFYERAVVAQKAAKEKWYKLKQEYIEKKSV